MPISKDGTMSAKQQHLESTLKGTELFYFVNASDEELEISQIKYYILQMGKHINNIEAQQHSNSLMAFPITEIINLLKDINNGNLPQLLQEVLNKLIIEFSEGPVDSFDLNSKRRLELNISLTGTALDKYSNLLRMLIGKEFTDNNGTIEKANSLVGAITPELVKAKLILGAMKIEKLCADIKDEYKTVCCPKLSMFSNRNSISQLSKLQSIVLSLRENKLANSQFIGGLLALNQKIGTTIKDKQDYTQFRYALRELLLSIGIPTETTKKSDRRSHYLIQPFIEYCIQKDINWPSPFSLTINSILSDTQESSALINHPP